MRCSTATSTGLYHFLVILHISCIISEWHHMYIRINVWGLVWGLFVTVFFSAGCSLLYWHSLLSQTCCHLGHTIHVEISSKNVPFLNSFILYTEKYITTKDYFDSWILQLSYCHIPSKSALCHMLYNIVSFKHDFPFLQIVWQPSHKIQIQIKLIIISAFIDCIPHLFHWNELTSLSISIWKHHHSYPHPFHSLTHTHIHIIPHEQ